LQRISNIVDTKISMNNVHFWQSGRPGNCGYSSNPAGMFLSMWTLLIVLKLENVKQRHGDFKETRRVCFI